MANSTKETIRKAGLRIPKVRKSGDLSDLQRRLWQTIEMCWTVIRSEKTTLEEKRQFGHLLGQTAGSYTRLCETLNLKDELESIKKELEDLRKVDGLRKVV